jgi:hypothetical protein
MAIVQNLKLKVRMNIFIVVDYHGNLHERYK